MDLLSHIEALETFSQGLATPGIEEIGHQKLRAGRMQGDPTSQRSMAFLARLGALPRVTRPIERRRSANGVSPKIRLSSIDESRLEANLCRLPNFEALLELIESGISEGAFQLVGDKVHIPLPSDSDVESSPFDVSPSFDITHVIERSAMALKARDAAELLQDRSSAMGGLAASGSGTGGGLPMIVRLRQEKDKPSPILRKGPAQLRARLRGKVRELLNRHPVVSSLEELGPDALFRISGPPIRMADGRYLPLEALREDTRAALTERLRELDGGKADSALYARVRELEPVDLPETFTEADAKAAVGDVNDLPSAARIELAYRLMKGIDLTTEQGEPIEATLRNRLEQTLGSSFTHVRLHTGPIAEWITENLQARGATAGEHVFIPQRRLSGEEKTAPRTLAHELVHVKQQQDHAISRPRFELESEATRFERQLTLPKGGRPLPPPTVQPLHTPRQPSAGVFLAEDRPDAPRAHKQREPAGPKVMELRKEETLEQLERRFVEEKQREKESSRDRVF